MITVSRRYQFAAAHVLRQPSLSDGDNERLYGKCANPRGHGHDYGLEVTITGDSREVTWLHGDTSNNAYYDNLAAIDQRRAVWHDGFFYFGADRIEAVRAD